MCMLVISSRKAYFLLWGVALRLGRGFLPVGPGTTQEQKEGLPCFGERRRLVGPQLGALTNPRAPFGDI